VPEYNPDLVVLDVMMPKISGYDICRQLREKYVLFELPIIMLTAKITVDDMIMAFKAGANDYVTKPVTREELLVRVKTFITLKHLIHENKEANYKLLQNRMNPHFLFNALNSINGYMFEDVNTARKALIQLSKTYQFLLINSDRSTVPFYDEWEFIKNYLEIEQLRFRNRFIVRMNMDGNFSDIVIPPLILQPLVENVFKHAFNDIEYIGEIGIHALREDDVIKISVVDNGVGLSNDDIFGRSLGNIKNRLRYYYKDAQLIAENRTPADKGVIVKIIFSVDSKRNRS
jgi:sensor histidine kinase YesM